MTDYYAQCCLLLPAKDFMEPEQPAETAIHSIFSASASLPLGARWLLSNHDSHCPEGWQIRPFDPIKKAESVFQQAFHAGFKKVLLLRPMVSGLQTIHLEEAYKSLKIIAFCIGPASDGTCWSLGMYEYNPLIASDQSIWASASSKYLIRQIGSQKEALYKCKTLPLA